MPSLEDNPVSSTSSLDDAIFNLSEKTEQLDIVKEMISKGGDNPRKELLLLYETIEKEIEEIEKKKNNILAFTKKSAALAILQEEDTSWFNDDQMNFLLSDLENKHENVRVIDAIDLYQNQGATLSENLQVIQGQLQQQLNNITNQRVKDTLIMPLNLGNRHWVALYIHFHTEDRARPAVGYFDPLGDDMPQELKQILKQVYLRLTSSDILACPIRLQSDGYNCGPWVIAILESLIANKRLPKENLNIHEVRKTYLERFDKRDNNNFIDTIARELILSVSFSKLTVSNNSKEQINMPNLQNVDDIEEQLTTLYHELQKAKSEIENFKGKRVVLFYGKTGAGKSTLLEYLKLPKETLVYKYCLDAYKVIIKEDFEGIPENSQTEEIYLRKTGNSLEARVNSIKKGERGNLTIPIDITIEQDLDEEFLSSNKNKILNQLLAERYIADKPAVTYKDDYLEKRFIGVGASSETSMPRFERVELKKLEIKPEVKKELPSTELYFCDLPGLSDNRGPVCDIITAYCIKQLICEADGVKFVFVERSTDLELANKDDYFSQIDHLLEMFPQVNVSELAKSVLIIGTQGDLSVEDLYSSMQEKSLNNPLKKNVKNHEKIQDFIEYIEDSLTVMKSPYSAFQQEKRNFSLYGFWEDKKGFVSNNEEYIGKGGFLLNLDIKPYLPKIVEPDRIVISMTKNSKLLMDSFVEIIGKEMEETVQEICIRYSLKINDPDNQNKDILTNIKTTLTEAGKELNKLCENIGINNLMQVLEKCTKLIDYPVDDSIGKYIKIVTDLGETLKNLPKLEKIKELILEKIKMLKRKFDPIVMQVETNLHNIEIIEQLDAKLSEMDLKISRLNQEGVPVPPELQNNQRETLEKLYQNKIQSKEKLIEETNKLIDRRQESLKKVERRTEVYPDVKKQKQLERKRRTLELTIAINQLEIKKKKLEDEQKSLLNKLATVSTRGGASQEDNISSSTSSLRGRSHFTLRPGQ